RCVLPRDIDVGIESAAVITGVVEGRLRRLEPEQLSIEPRHHIVALEAPAFVESSVVELKRALALDLHAADFVVDAGPAPIGKPTVEFVPSGPHGGRWVGVEFRLQQSAHIVVPCNGERRYGGRRRWADHLLAAGNDEQKPGGKQRQGSRRDPCFHLIGWWAVRDSSL